MRDAILGDVGRVSRVENRTYLTEALVKRRAKVRTLVTIIAASSQKIEWNWKINCAPIGEEAVEAAMVELT